MSETRHFGKACLSVLVSLCLALSVCLGPTAFTSQAYAESLSKDDARGASCAASPSFANDESAKDSEQPRTVEEVEQSIGPEDSYVSDEILVRYENGEVDLIDVDHDESVAEAIVEAEADSRIEAVQPNYKYDLMDYVPNDPFCEELHASSSSNAWHLDAVNAFGAWELARANQSVTVAVVDSGCQMNHPDLAGNLWTGEARDVSDEVLLGYEGETEITGVPFVPCLEDKADHGTAVAGCIAARADNGIGTAGTSFNAKVLPICVIDGDTGSITTASVCRALSYIHELADSRTDMNIRVVNMSIGGPAGAYVMTGSDGESVCVVDTVLKTAVDRMADDGILVVSAAGNANANSSIPTKETPVYPSDFDSVLSVTATSEMGEAQLASCCGPEKDLAAPGYLICSTAMSGAYSRKSGTSFSAPIVSGAAALMFAAYPDATRQEVFDALCETTSKKVTEDGTESDQYGAGILDEAAALKHLGETHVQSDISMQVFEPTIASPDDKPSTPEEEQPEQPEKPVLLTPNFKYKSITKTHGASSFTNSFNVKSGVSYSTSNTKVLRVSSAGKVTITGPGIAYVKAKVTNASYKAGMYSYKVTVKPKPTTLTSKTKSLLTGRIRVAWKVGTSTISGYQIKYRKKGSSKWTYKLVKGRDTVRKATAKLKRGKSYYVKIRTYKVASGKKLYSSWSKSKIVKICK